MKISLEALRMLERDITLWDKLAKVYDPKQIGRSNFELCNEYFNKFMCDHCPVKEHHKVKMCKNSVYADYIEGVDKWRRLRNMKQSEAKHAIKMQSLASSMAEYLREAHPDNEPMPDDTLPTLEEAIELAKLGRVVGVLVSFTRASPLWSGFLRELRDRYRDFVIRRRTGTGVLFEGGGEIVLLNDERDWDGRTFYALHINSKPRGLLPYSLRQLKERVIPQ